jgi:small ubiquitin-related modifier
MESSSSSSSPSPVASTKPETTPQQPPDDDKVTLRLIGSDGKEIIIRVAKKTTFDRVFKAYNTRTDSKPGTVRFLFDGTRINETDTPKSLELEDNDVIDALLQQTGGNQ